MSFKLCSIILVTLMSYIGIVSSIKCYQCITLNDMCETTSQPVDCNATTTNPMFGNAHLPAEAFGGQPGSMRYCHRVTMESGTVIRTCLYVDRKNISNTCNVMKSATAAEAADKKVNSCFACESDNCNGAESGKAKSSGAESGVAKSSGADTFSSSLALFALTLSVSYLHVVLKQL